MWGATTQNVERLESIPLEQNAASFNMASVYFHVCKIVQLCFENRERKPLFFVTEYDVTLRRCYSFKTLRTGPIRTKKIVERLSNNYYEAC